MPKVYKHNALLLLAIAPMMFACTKSKFSAVKNSPPPVTQNISQPYNPAPYVPPVNRVPVQPRYDDCNGNCQLPPPPRPIQPPIVRVPQQPPRPIQPPVAQLPAPRPVAPRPVAPPVVAQPAPCQDVIYNHSNYQPGNYGTRGVNIWLVVDGSKSFPIEKEDAIRALMRDYTNNINIPTTFSVISGHSRVSSDSVTYQNRMSDFFYKNDPSEPAVVRLKPGMSAEERRAQEDLLVSKILGMRTDNTRGKSDGGELLVYNLSAALHPQRLEWARSVGAFSDHNAFGVVFMSDENDICTQDRSRPVKQSEAEAYRDHCVGMDNTANVIGALQQISKIKPVFASGYIYTGETQIPQDMENDNGIGLGMLDIIQANKGLAIDLGAMASGRMTYSGAAERLAKLTHVRGKMDQARYQIVSKDGRPVPFNQLDMDRTKVYVDGKQVQHQVKDNYLHFGGCQPQSQIRINYCNRGR